MDSFTPYDLPAIVFSLLGVGLLVLGCGLMYDTVPDEPKYSYSVEELEDPLSDSDAEVIQFGNLSETGQKAFLESLHHNRSYHSDERASEITISSDYRIENHIEYRNQTYVFVADTNYTGWWLLLFMVGGCAAIVGLFAIPLGVWFVRNNEFKLPTAILTGVLALGLLRLIMVFDPIEPPPTYDTIARLLLLVPVLSWLVLSWLEWYWNTSFSQRMDR